MKHNDIEMTVLVKGSPITEYNHRGQTFVEGRDGSDYEIEIRNRTAGRIEAVLSVDGLSVIDGKPAGASSSGYLIDAGQTILIPGWKLDDSTVAKFAFAGKGESYATKMTGDSRNNGVIGVMAFNEKYVAPRNYGLARDYGPVYASGASLSSQLHNGWASPGASTTMVDQSHMPLAASVGHARSMHAAAPPASTDGYFDAADCMSQEMSQNAVNSLGTAFGESASFRTSKVEFKRGDLISMQIIYYDEAKGLTQRGIQLAKPKTYRTQSTPDAFPAMSKDGCVPPEGWAG